MEIHKPHAAKTWREFLVELATITAGILIALTLEQVIEWQHASHRAREARENIRVEIADNLGWMELRTGVEQCVSTRLEELGQLLQESAAFWLEPTRVNERQPPCELIASQTL